MTFARASRASMSAESFRARSALHAGADSGSSTERPRDELELRRAGDPRGAPLGRTRPPGGRRLQTPRRRRRSPPCSRRESAASWRPAGQPSVRRTSVSTCSGGSSTPASCRRAEASERVMASSPVRSSTELPCARSRPTGRTSSLREASASCRPAPHAREIVVTTCRDSRDRITWTSSSTSTAGRSLRHRPRTRRLSATVVRIGPLGAQRLAHIPADRLDGVEREHDRRQQRPRVVVLGIELDPCERAPVAGFPLGEDGRLSVAGRRDNEGHRQLAGIHQPPDETLTRHEPRA